MHTPIEIERKKFNFNEKNGNKILPTFKSNVTETVTNINFILLDNSSADGARQTREQKHLINKFIIILLCRESKLRFPDQNGPSAFE